VLGDWDRPYLTMNYSYEAATAHEFNKFLLSDAVVRNKKPVYWCSTCATALAEAEVEYHQHTSPSVYVKFQAVESFADIDEALGGEKTYIVIWTTTPWTLPANRGLALHPDFVYSAVKVGDEVWIVASDLVEKVMEECEVADFSVVATFSSKGLEHKKCKHPFVDRHSLVVLADYVTTEAGTGCVHTAPGHGADDYITGLKYDLEVFSPVDNDGYFTQDAGKYAGKRIPQVNGDIIRDMTEDGSLIMEKRLEHSYPHCWRCKEPVIYRATPQWFISMSQNDLRKKSLAAIKEVSWTPAWGMQRI